MGSLKQLARWFTYVLIGVVLIFAAYAIYVAIFFQRIPDHRPLTIQQPTHSVLKADSVLSVASYNVGFGAYTPEFSFFMDGGAYSRAFSRDSVRAATSGAAQDLHQLNADFYLLQEVDTDSTRSHRVNQQQMFAQSFSNYASVYAVNYDSPYLFYPITQPHGQSLSGIQTLSRYQISDATRRSLPVAKDWNRVFDLDRAYAIIRIPVDNGRVLSVFNVHLSAYTEDKSVKDGQLKMLFADMQAELAAGHYVLVGGDFNADLLGNSSEIFHNKEQINELWTKPLDLSNMPQGFDFATNILPASLTRTQAPSCRNANKPYVKGDDYVLTVDGFIVSNNIELLDYRVLNHEFAYSDHQPVWLQFRMK